MNRRFLWLMSVILLGCVGSLGIWPTRGYSQTRPTPTPAAVPTSPAKPNDTRGMIRATAGLDQATITMQTSVEGLSAAQREQIFGTPERGDRSRPEQPRQLQRLFVEWAESNVHVDIQDPRLMLRLGLKPAAIFTFMTTPRVAFVRGPIPLLGAFRPQWYRIATNSSNPIRPLFDQLRSQTDPRQALERFAAQRDLRWLRVNASANRMINGQSCQAASSTNPTQVLAALRLLGLDQPDLITGSTPSAADFTIWTCPDGYLHLIEASLTIPVPDRPRIPLTLTFQLNLIAIGSPTTIDLPGASINLDNVDITPTATGMATPNQTPVLIPTAVSATVANGGNVRDDPTLQGAVLDQVNAQEMVPLLGRTNDGQWYRIATPRGVTGWVNVSLLRVSSAVAAQVPVVAP
ncbi:MAG: hypothetical protein OHK0050_08970 [Roseiflexaceae bacterium]